MAEMETLTVILPLEVVQRIRARVQAGEFASESELIAHSIRDEWDDVLPVLSDEDEDEWLDTEVIPALERLEAGQEKKYTADEVRQHLAAMKKQTAA